MISFLIVNWNGGSVFKKCIKSIYAELQNSKVRHFEIVVVDNNSNNLDLSWLNSCKNLTLIRNAKNELFAKATNQSVDASVGEILFILNNDIILKNGCLNALLDELSSSEVDAVVPKLIYPNGKTQKSVVGLPALVDIFYAAFGINYLNKRFNAWLGGLFDFDKRQNVLGQPAFSALLIKRSAWQRVGPLDENFPLLWNDTDWFFRFQKLGMKCVYTPIAQAEHIHGMSVNRNRIKKVIASTRSMRRYFIKNHKTRGFDRLVLEFLSGWILIAGSIKEVMQMIYLRLKTTTV
jgi:GT2 family glycosyltransferase